MTPKPPPPTATATATAPPRTQPLISNRPAPMQAPPPQTTSNTIGQASGKKFTILSGKRHRAELVVLYGPGGIGKSTLAGLAPNPCFIETEPGAHKIDLPKVIPYEQIVEDGNLAKGWTNIREVLRSDCWEDVGTIVIDTITRAEDLAKAWTLENVPSENGRPVTSIEGYGYGKGYTHLYETFMRLLPDLRAHTRAGRNVILISHECLTEIKNPFGENYDRYEPRLQHTKNTSIRYQLKEECDQMFFIAYDIAVKDGKARGNSTRTIYTAESPYCMAKNRDVPGPMYFDTPTDARIWQAIFNTTKES